MGAHVNVWHDAYLAITLDNVHLIDAYSIDPEKRWHGRVVSFAGSACARLPDVHYTLGNDSGAALVQVSQCGVEVQSNMKLGAVKANDSGSGIRAPHTRKSFIAGPFCECFMDEAAAYVSVAVL